MLITIIKVYSSDNNEIDVRRRVVKQIGFNGTSVFA